MNNQELHTRYNAIYAEGKEKFFTFSTADVSQEVLAELDWTDRTVLEVGCGTGETAYLIARAGGKILAVDYAEAAIQEAQRRHAHPNLTFGVASLEQVEGQHDVIVVQEVIEHLDDPRAALVHLTDHLLPSGHLIVTCPSFLNLRGYIWMTLQLLLDVPMSLTDRHFICPFDMVRWASELGFQCRWRTFRHSQAHGEQMLIDMKKRLTNALRDANLNHGKVDVLLQWFDLARRYEVDAAHNGAKALYHFTFPHGTERSSHDQQD